MFITAVLWTGFFVINFNIAMMIPLLPFIQRDIGLTPSQAGIVLAAFPVVALLSNLVLGPFIDRFGRRRFLIAGATACALLFVATAAARGALWIAIARAVTGVFMPMVGASIFAAIADYFPPDRRARVAGIVTSAAPVAFLCCMSMGVWLGGLLAWQLPVGLLALIVAGLAAGASALPPTPAEALSVVPISRESYRNRLLSLSLDAGTRLLLMAFFCWSAAVFVFLGLYPSWVVQRGLAEHGAGAIGTMLFLGEIGGLLGALLSGRLSRLGCHPMTACAVAAMVAAGVVTIIPSGSGILAFQAIAYGIFAFGRDLMLALMLGGAMLLVPAAQRGSLNAVMNAIYQTGATCGGLAGAWLYAFSPNFIANALMAGGLFAASGTMLWAITRIKVPSGGVAVEA